MCIERVNELRRNWINSILEEELDEDEKLDEGRQALADLIDIMEQTSAQRPLVAALGALEVYLDADLVVTANLLSTFALRLRQMAREQKS